MSLGKPEDNADCKKFLDTIVPAAFQKVNKLYKFTLIIYDKIFQLQTTKSVFSWPREIQCGIFEMIELFIDLVGIRLRYAPVPVQLLNTLALVRIRINFKKVSIISFHLFIRHLIQQQHLRKNIRMNHYQHNVYIN